MIGGEGALVLGGFASAAIAIPLVLSKVPPVPTLLIMALAGMIVGGVWVGIVGYLRHARGVNETISSLLLTYIGIAIMNFFVEGSLRDLSNPNKPSTMPLGDAYMIVGGMPVRATVSIGIAAIPDHDAEDLNALMRKADAALYDAKRAGRDCVVPFAA